jgi:hypothetical protein
VKAAAPLPVTVPKVGVRVVVPRPLFSIVKVLTSDGGVVSRLKFSSLKPRFAGNTDRRLKLGNTAAEPVLSAS